MKRSGEKNKKKQHDCISSRKFFPTPNQKQAGNESSGMPSVTGFKGLLQIAEVQLDSLSSSAKLLALCDSACSHSWISRNLAHKLRVEGSATKLTVHGINSQQVVDTETVEVKLMPVHSSGSCSTFHVTPYVRDDLKVRNDIIDVDNSKKIYPHLEPIPLSTYSYSNVEMILGQDVFHCIHPLEYFEADRPNTPIAVGLGTEGCTSFHYGSFLDLFQSYH